MPPHFIDRARLPDIVQATAVPALERLAQFPALRDRALRRFDSSDPGYASSTDSEEDRIATERIAKRFGLSKPMDNEARQALSDEINSIMDDKPLANYKRGRIESLLEY